MKRLFFPVTILLLMLTGCALQKDGASPSETGIGASSIIQETDAVQENDPDLIAGDMGKGAVCSNGWIYYGAIDEQGYSLYKMAEDGSQAEKIIPAYISSMAVGNDVLYYIGSYDINGSDEENCKLYKVDLTTGTKTLLMEEVDEPLCLVGDYLYFNDTMPYQTEYEIFRLDLSVVSSVSPGTIEDLLKTPALIRMNATSPDNAPIFYDGWLYYTTRNAEFKDWAIRRMRYDGSEDEQFYKVDPLRYMELLGFYNGQLFFSSGSHDELYSLDEDGSLTDYPNIEDFESFDGRWAYFAEEDTGVYRCSVENGEKELVAEDRGFTSVAGDWLFTWQWTDKNQFIRYIMPKDGGAETALIGHYVEPLTEAPPEPEPEYTLKTVGKGSVTLKMRNEDTMACYKLVSCDEGNPVIYSVLVDPYTELTLKFDYGYYNVKVAYGDEWLGDDKAFGESGEYMISEMYSFNSGFVYELSTSSARGDFSTYSMSGFVGK